MKRKNANRGLAPIWMLSLGMALTGSAEIFADPIPCISADYTTANNVSDVTFGVLDSGPQPADACYGPIVGNEDTDSLYNFGSEGGDWYFLAKWDFEPKEGEPNATDGSISFSYPTEPTSAGIISFNLAETGINDQGTSDKADDTVSYKLSWIYDPDYWPVTLDLNVVTKQSNGYIQYFFDNETLLADSGVNGFGTGEFIINFQCSGKPNSDDYCRSTNDGTTYSHFGFYGRNPVANPNFNPGPTPAPIPAPLALIGIGGMMLGWMTRKLRA